MSDPLLKPSEPKHLYCILIVVNDVSAEDTFSVTIHSGMVCSCKILEIYTCMRKYLCAQGYPCERLGALDMLTEKF